MIPSTSRSLRERCARGARYVLSSLALGVGLLALVQQGGCSLFHDDYPDDRCETTADCFEEQGETCNTETKRCEPGVDAGS